MSENKSSQSVVNPANEAGEDSDFFPQTSKIIRENMEEKAELECDDGDAINGAFFLDNDGDD
ncbi:hypothetical protein [Acetobacter pasteurianus]|uniref:hypothetical protein n=1 Tax=Acetobacter pasteurianus TaxID=438 RepID=UPI0013648548|nr:hypothetical protein [Acetobacter pasteurianus]QHM90367.1 hypothetical protein FCN51_01890 [Acetobacter pasteurianus]